ncbi:MAG: ABC transporter ATP-binding protein [Syntrophomonadaceae bacterium]|nr:ABC transporter ATP-binding protein [Syntrophomonadaceae bacterium]
MSIVLQLQKISQEFGGLRALDMVSLSVEEGAIFGIIGPNGAGKTTLFNIISGIYTPTSGRLIYLGQEIQGLKAWQVARMGIARTYQNIRLFQKLSVLDNVRVGGYGRERGGFIGDVLTLPGARRQEKETMERTKELLDFMGLYERRWDYAVNLAYGEQRRLEIARALALDPQLLLLDEPAAGMNPQEKEELMATIRLIREQRDITILLVEHDMNLVMNICEHIAVLDYGSKIAEGTPEDIKRNEQVIHSYLGA